MKIIRRKTDYALRCLVTLAETSSGKVVSVRKLAEQEDIPEDLLHKVMRALTQAKLVKPIRGRTGGFRLAKPANKITIRKVIEVLQQPFDVSTCFINNENCLHQDHGGLCNKFETVQNELISFLDKVTLADLIDHAETTSPSA